MSTPLAKVAFVSGEAWAKAPDGSQRLLKLGDTVNVHEVVVTAEGARIELDFGSGPTVVVRGDQEVALGADLWEVTATDPTDAALAEASIQQALTIFEQGGDLLEELEATAAGGGDAGGGGGNSFVQVGRDAVDPINEQQFVFGALSREVSGGRLTAVNGVNGTPEAADQTVTLEEDSSFVGQVLATDRENDTLTFTLINSPANGTLTLDPQTGEFTYQPDPNYAGTDSFTVIISDGRGSTTSTVSLNVTAVNDVPTTGSINLQTDEDTTVTGQVMAEDIDGDTLSYTLTTSPINGTLILDPISGQFTYQPNAHFNGSDSFIITVSDGQGGSVASTVSIDVAPVNDNPATVNLSLSTPENVVVSGQVTATDVDGDQLSYAVSTGANYGSVILDPATGQFTYTPAQHYVGSDSFVVTVSDGQGGSTTSTITLAITPVPIVPANTAPVTNNLTLITDEDTAVNGQVMATDIDGDALTYVVSTAATNGTVSLNSTTGQFVYTPNANYVGNDSFVVTVSDGNGGTTTSTIALNIMPVNDAPVTNNLSLITDEDTAVNGQVVATDIDGDALTYVVSTAATNGTVSLNSTTGQFVYTPNADYFGNDSFVVTVSDGNGGSDTASINVTVNPVTMPPIAVDDSTGSPYTVNLGSAGSSIWATADSKGLAVGMTALRADGSVGTFYRNGNQLGVAGSPRPSATANAEPNQIEYNPGTATSESVRFNFNGNLTSATFSVSNLVATENGGEVGYWAAYYQGSLVADSTFRLTSGNAGSFAINTGGLAFDSVVFSARHTVNGTGDGGGYFLTSFSGSGSAEVNTAYVVAENGVLNISSTSAHRLLANDSDPDGDPISLTQINGVAITSGQVVTLTSGALVMANADGSFSYSPDGHFASLAPGQVATDSFTYTIADGKGGIASATASVTIIGVDNAAPAPVFSHQISSSSGGDTLVGTLGADTFKWNLNDNGTAGAPVQDRVLAFDRNQGDVLDLRDLLQGESNATLSNYLHVNSDGTHTTLHISSSGGYSGGIYAAAQTDQIVLLQNVNLSGSDSADIITQLKNNGNLLTD